MSESLCNNQQTRNDKIKALLKEGKTYAEIEKLMHCSSVTIARVSRNNDERDEAIRGLLKQGKTYKEIMQIVHCSSVDIAAVVKKYGKSNKECRKIAIRDRDIRNLIKRGFKNKDIAEKMNVSVSVVESVKYRMKIKEQEENRDRLENIDRGKVRALYNAHWTIKNIAGDLGCSEYNVVKVLKEEKLIKN